jgi:hypothetical protein
MPEAAEPHAPHLAAPRTRAATTTRNINRIHIILIKNNENTLTINQIRGPKSKSQILTESDIHPLTVFGISY